jgi:hypothetical protein
MGRRLSTEIVDDIALTKALREHGLERRFVPSCTVACRCDFGVADGRRWLTRQMQYSQIYFKPLYAAFFLSVHVCALALVLTPVAAVIGLVAGDRWLLAASALVALWHLLLGLLVWAGVPAASAPAELPRYRLGRFLAAVPPAILVATCALAKTRLQAGDGLITMHWRQIDYLVEAGSGRVVEIRRQAEARPHADRGATAA